MAYFNRNTHLDKPGYMRLSTPWGSPKNNNNLQDRNLLDQHVFMFIIGLTHTSHMVLLVHDTSDSNKMYISEKAKFLVRP